MSRAQRLSILMLAAHFHACAADCADVQKVVSSETSSSEEDAYRDGLDEVDLARANLLQIKTVQRKPALMSSSADNPAVALLLSAQDCMMTRKVLESWQQHLLPQLTAVGPVDMYTCCDSGGLSDNTDNLRTNTIEDELLDPPSALGRAIRRAVTVQPPDWWEPDITFYPHASGIQNGSVHPQYLRLSWCWRGAVHTESSTAYSWWVKIRPDLLFLGSPPSLSSLSASMSPHGKTFFSRLFGAVNFPAYDSLENGYKSMMQRPPRHYCCDQSVCTAESHPDPCFIPDDMFFVVPSVIASDVFQMGETFWQYFLDDKDVCNQACCAEGGETIPEETLGVYLTSHGIDVSPISLSAILVKD